MNALRKITFLLFTLISFVSYAQVHSSNRYEYLISTKQQKQHITELTSSNATGRATGTGGANLVRDYIANEFKSYGLKIWRGKHIHKFLVNSGKYSIAGQPPLDGYNVTGFIPSHIPNSNYIIIGAHYDHMGTINDKVFPGADDNASGVAALLELAKAFGEMYQRGDLITSNIIFVAFDANNRNCQGSKQFAKDMLIAPHKITCMINIDQIGSSLSPVSENLNYMLILGADKLKVQEKAQIDFANKLEPEPLELDYTYYNSPGFYNIFYKLSDQQSFTEKGIPALLFTSGITTVTNKESDNISNLNIPVLDRRIKVIYRFIYLLARM